MGAENPWSDPLTLHGICGTVIDMRTWNVLVPVVQLVNAENADSAEAIAQKQVQAACNTFGDVYEVGIESFESEDQSDART